MTLSINTNTAAMAALESLSATSSALTMTENQVSTGKKVSSASDNPAIYAISQSMQGNISGLSAVSDSLSLGAQVVNTASKATADIISTLQTLQNTVTSAGSTGYDTSTMETQVANAINQINSYARNSTFNGVNVLTTSGDVTATGAPSTTGAASIVTGLSGTKLTVPNQITGSSVLSSFLGLTSTNFTAGGSAYSTSAAATAAGASANNSQTVLSSSTSGVNIATTNSLSSSDFANGSNVVLTNGDGTTTTFEFDASGTKTTSAESSTNHVVTVLVATGSQSTSTMLGALVNAMNNNGYNAVIQNDGSINVTGKGVVSSTANDGTTTGGATSTATSVGISSGTTLTASAAAITTVQSAINKMDSIATSLGASTQQITGMQSFTSDLSDALTAGVGGLTDADLSAASAKLTSLQTKQSLAIQSLSIANSQSQSILSLFR